MENLGAMVVGESDLMPSQWADLHRSRDEFEHERNLLLRAFESHIDDYRAKPRALGGKPTSRRDTWHAQAVAWVDDDTDGLLSFRWFCGVLGLDCEAVRTALRKPRPAPIATGFREDGAAYMRAYRKARPEVRAYNREWMARSRA